MKNTERIDEHILKDVRRNTPFNSKEDFSDDEINKKSNREIFDHWLQWNGLIGYTSTIISVVENIYGVKLV